MYRDLKPKNRKGFLQSNYYKIMVTMLQEEKYEERFQSLRDVGVYWESTKYLLPRAWPYDGARKSPMTIYFNLRKPQSCVPWHSRYEYIKFSTKRIKKTSKPKCIVGQITCTSRA